MSQYASLITVVRSSGHGMFQDWVFTVPKEREHQFSGRGDLTELLLTLARKNVSTLCRLALSLAASAVPSIRLRRLHVVENHPFQFKNNR